LLNVAAGGTAIEGWLPEEIVGEYPDLHEKLETVRAPGYIERLQREADEAARTWHEELGRKDAGVAEGWHSPDYIYENPAAEPGDNDGWHNRLLLDNTGFTHGTVWFRKKVNLEEVPHGPVTLDLGRAADSVAVYVNGTLVKSVDYQYPPCLCELPSGMLKKGENIIAIRLTGSGQKPGFVPGKKYALSYPGGRIDLSGYWKCRVGAEMPAFLGWPWFYGHPCCVYNHMLAPVLGVMVDGVIWYQGESNTYNPPMYRELFTRFVELLRLSLGGDCPVIFTQLANYLDFGGTGENWAALREQQRLCLSIPNTAMAVAIDCGEYNDLHPLDKKSVGERLALHALRMVYGHDIVTNGPVVSHVTQQDGRFTVHFRNARGLWAKNGRPVVELVTDGFDDEIHRLYASVEGETLVVDANVLRGAVKVPRVVRVRFGWTDNPPVTLYNAHNLPASPFEISVEA
jgi:sialate O-acetylesterase